ncbi:MAG TPA: CHASE3 domain-containing protein [Thermoanaerobaculia bacterium]|nr:CHASE3 domain-containing protein [Thermoanaerobaculia bacterium]
MANQTSLIDRTLRRAVLLPVAVAIVVGVVFLGIIQQLLSETELLRHSEEVVATAEQMRQVAVDMETGVRGYLLTRDPRFLAPRDRASADLPRLLLHLKELVADNPEQARRVSAIEADIRQWQLYAARTLNADPRGWNLFAGKILMDRVRSDHEQFLNAEHALSLGRARRVRETTLAAIVLTIVLAAVAGAILVSFIRRQLLDVRLAYEKALAGAEEAVHAKDRMLATVSHELRTPLTSILGWTALLRMRDSDREFEELALASIEQSARLQARLVEDLIDVSRMAAGKLRIEVADVDVASALAAAVEAMTPAADAKGVTLKVSIAGGDLRMGGDAARLQQVFWNLISNAVRFTPAGGRVDVAAARNGDAIVVPRRRFGHGHRSRLPPAYLRAVRTAERVGTLIVRPRPRT